MVEIMASLGFTEITKKAMLLSVGHVMTIPKGATMKGIAMEKIVKAFRRKDSASPPAPLLKARGASALRTKSVCQEDISPCHNSPPC